jgi:hypothetical protein
MPTSCRSHDHKSSCSVDANVGARQVFDACPSDLLGSDYCCKQALSQPILTAEDYLRYGDFAPITTAQIPLQNVNRPIGTFRVHNRRSA